MNTLASPHCSAFPFQSLDQRVYVAHSVHVAGEAKLLQPIAELRRAVDVSSVADQLPAPRVRCQAAQRPCCEAKGLDVLDLIEPQESQELLNHSSLGQDELPPRRVDQQVPNEHQKVEVDAAALVRRVAFLAQHLGDDMQSSMLGLQLLHDRFPPCNVRCYERQVSHHLPRKIRARPCSLSAQHTHKRLHARRGKNLTPLHLSAASRRSITHDELLHGRQDRLKLPIPQRLVCCEQRDHGADKRLRALLSSSC
mmetsp:Transcript_45152/g.142153  ORF Transcript_45152/g.142153 Transcript_45152/m.142153 type:complete len:253 (+) Transcript_45152:1196-1954(+)